MAELNNNLRAFIGERRIASVATINPDNSIHITAVWYLFEDDIFYIGVSSHSRKWKNIIVRPQVSIMIDSRVAAKERGITAIGAVQQITGDESKLWVRRIHERYLTPDALDDPMVGSVYAVGDDVTMKIIPQQWLTWDIAEHDAKNLGGRLSNHNYTYPLDL
jgi:nitroimidazol reductase NimA-like FMN-containing flavoprotein (pyridoxamine 5'-phosphate oxidase superfamily)